MKLRRFRKIAIDKNASLLTLTVALAMVLGLMFVSTPVAHAQTFSVIHTFTGSGGDGAIPYAGVTVRAGTLFGTTEQGGIGGVSGPGTVYQMTHTPNGWNYTPIFLFPANKSGGANPSARVVFGPDGHLYGTTSNGGASKGGVVFNLTPPLSICKTAYCSWKENVLHTFGGSDGVNPGYGDLIWDQWNDQGNIYGTTVNGGVYGVGIVYELTKSGSNWTETIPFSFDPYSYCPAALPWAGVTHVSAGFFGTSTNGNFNGALWELGGSGLTCPVRFDGNGPAGELAYAGLTADASENLYGAASDLGVSGGGTVFELTSPDYTLNFTYSFSGMPGQQCGPFANITLDAAGNIYGTTRCDGANNLGNVFKLTKVGNTWVYTSLHDFTGVADGAYPISNVTIDSDGTLYGTTSQGGTYGDGVVWMIKP